VIDTRIMGGNRGFKRTHLNPRDSSRFKDPHLDFSSLLEQTSISFERRTSRMQPRCGKCFRVRQFSIFKSGHIKRMINNDSESRVRARFRDRTEVLFCAAQEPRVMHPCCTRSLAFRRGHVGKCSEGVLWGLASGPTRHSPRLQLSYRRFDKARSFSELGLWPIS
jgi:hypothetical protein